MGSPLADSAPVPEIFDVQLDPQFHDVQHRLKPLARKYRPGKPNDFCVVGYALPDVSRYAWVFWKQRHELILWDAGETDIDLSRRKLDLKKHVVATEADVQGSSYLVTRAWVDKVLDDCARRGTRVRIGK